MSANVVVVAQTAASSVLSTVSTTATAVNASINALGNFAQAANIKSNAWLEEVREDTEDLSIQRRGLRDQRIASKIANEAHAIQKSIQDPEIKKLYDAALKNLQAAREAAAK